MENENPKLKRNSDERARHQSNFFVSWMNRLAAAYRQEIPMETQAMYLDALSDLSLDRLDQAFKRALRECRFVPTIAELRAFEAAIVVSTEQIQAAYERRKQAQLAGPAPKLLKSVLDEPKPKAKRSLRLLTEAEHAERVEFLKKQVQQLTEEA